MSLLFEIPPEISEAAKLVENWMKEHGASRWEFRGICSRNYADTARRLELYTLHTPSCPFPKRDCDCGLKADLESLSQ